MANKLNDQAATRRARDGETGPSSSRPDWHDDFDRDELDAIGAVRARLEIDEEISDLTIAASLAAVAAKGDPRARWLAAFTSPLGKWLATRGTDLNTALNVLMAYAPRSS